VEHLQGELKPNVNAALFAQKAFVCCSFHMICTFTCPYWAHGETHKNSVTEHQSWSNRLNDTST